MEWKSSKMSSFKSCKGKVLDARLTNYNEVGDDFKSAKTYLYFQYTVAGVVHGGSAFSIVKNVKARLALNEIISKFDGAPLDADVYYDPCDPRKSYLFNTRGTSTNILNVAIAVFIVALIFYVKGW